MRPIVGEVIPEFPRTALRHSHVWGKMGFDKGKSRPANSVKTSKIYVKIQYSEPA